MKRIFSAILAVLMLLGCVSFSAFATDSNPDILDILGAKNVITLTAPVATAPDLTDGVFTASEYSVKIEHTSAGEYIVRKTGIYGAAVASRPFTEYFAYDDYYIYYAVVNMTGNDLPALGGWSGIQVAAANDVSFSNVDAYAYQNFVSDVYSNIGAGYVFDKTGETKRYYTAAGVNDMVNRKFELGCGDYTGSYYQTFEIKIARSQFGNDVDTYALYTHLYGNNIAFGTNLTDAQKAAIGEGAPDILPRFIIIEEEPIVVEDLVDATNSNIKLTKAIATAPDLTDGTIGANEYSVVIEHTGKEYVVSTTFADKFFNYPFTEYFAYDAEYIYYAIKNTYGANFPVISAATHNVDVQFTAANDVSLTNTAAYAYTNFNDTLGSIGETYFSHSTGDFYYDADGNKWPASNGFEVAKADAVSGHYQGIEFKIPRDRFNGADTFAFYTEIWGGRCAFGANLTDAQKAAIGEGAPDVLPRFIVIEDELVTQRKASVRISSTANGLRFKTEVNNEVIADLINNGYEVSVGTLIAPTNTLGANALTHSLGVENVAYINVRATLDQPFTEGVNFNIYAGSITDIKDSNLGREFSAVGYIAYTKDNVTQYYYSDVTSSRSAAYVAQAALDDYAKDNSLYTPEQVTLIQALLPKES